MILKILPRSFQEKNTNVKHFEKKSSKSQLFHKLFTICFKGTSIIYEIQGLCKALALGYY